MAIVCTFAWACATTGTDDGVDSGAGGPDAGTGPVSTAPYLDGGFECEGVVPTSIAGLLTSTCDTCHGPTLAGGAPMHLVSYADLVADSAAYPGQTIGQRCVARIQSTDIPMPPGKPGQVAAADVSAFASWVSMGMPPDTLCYPPGQPPDAGVDPFGLPPTCTSNTYYTHGDGTQMEPGNACIACHTQSNDGPRYTVAGTVYPTGHEPSECDGTNVSGAVVVVTDANGAVTNAPVNQYGNFYVRTALTMPFHVKVTYEGRERAMSDAPTSGDCNTCHTQDGLMNAPGRIVLP